MKRISINFWMIFDKNENGGDSPEQRPVSKEFLKNLQGLQTKVYIFADDGPPPAKIEGRAPEFQKEIILQAMRERLDAEDMPYSGVAIDRPYAEINLDRKITQHMNWEEVLLKKLNGKKAGG